MNIFALDPDPKIAASMHCDQHLHKMILESAQMLSTWLYHSFPKTRPHIYKPSYENHPCTQWVFAHTDNRTYLVYLARELDSIRQDNGSDEHLSSRTIEIAADCIGCDDFPELYQTPETFVFAGPAYIALRHDINIHEKYKLYYRHKHKEWLDTRRPMSYKGRPVPDFMADLIME
jgi:hypothetical protein